MSPAVIQIAEEVVVLNTKMWYSITAFKPTAIDTNGLKDWFTRNGTIVHS